jgi:hypothetical protein
VALAFFFVSVFCSIAPDDIYRSTKSLSVSADMGFSMNEESPSLPTSIHLLAASGNCDTEPSL